MRGELRCFTAEGLNMERLVTQAGKEGVRLLGLRREGRRRLAGCVRAEDMPRLVQMAETGGWKLVPGRPAGAAKVLEALRRRRAACLLCLLAVAAGWAASLFLWRIEVVDAGAYGPDVRAALAEEGVRPMMLRRDVDLPALQDALAWRYPKVAWVQCSWRGGTLRVTLTEGAQEAAPVALTGVMDVVADRAGVVERIVTMAGTPCVKAGQTVRAGEVLIRGEERGEDGSVNPVYARGTVFARVWDGAAVRMSSTGVETTWTGREETHLQMETPWFVLGGEAVSPYACADVTESLLPLGGVFLPVFVRRTTYAEAERSSVRLPEEALRAQAGEIARRRLGEKVGFGEEFVDKWVDYSMIENGDIVAIAIGERVIDIAGRASPP